MSCTRSVAPYVFLLAGLGAGPTLAATDAAGQGVGDADAQFEELDADGDGTLSRSEFAGLKTSRTAHGKLDSNRDGSVDRLEFAAFEGADAAADGAEYESDAYLSDDYGTAPEAQKPGEGDADD